MDRLPDLPDRDLPRGLFPDPVRQHGVHEFSGETETGAYIKQFTLGNYARALRDPFYWKVLKDTFWYALLTTGITLVLGYPLAYHIARAPKRWRGWLLVLLISPLLVSIIVRSFGWMILLGKVGIINTLVRRSEDRNSISCTMPSAS
jgi:ABC-type spermidine/putrescine transport system permease subunit I